jgi:hypothetical protein
MICINVYVANQRLPWASRKTAVLDSWNSDGHGERKAASAHRR